MCGSSCCEMNQWAKSKLHDLVRIPISPFIAQFVTIIHGKMYEIV